MPNYEAIAANEWFFQTLTVHATNEHEALAKFRAFLATPESLAHEEYEYAQVQGLGDEAAPNTLDRNSYKYRIRDVTDVAETDDTASAEVQMVNSGGNG